MSARAVSVAAVVVVGVNVMVLMRVRHSVSLRGMEVSWAAPRYTYSTSRMNTITVDLVVVDQPSRWTPRWDQLAGYRASMTLLSTESASRVPSASPFSKSTPSWPIVLVTCARQRSRTPADRAKA